MFAIAPIPTELMRHNKPSRCPQQTFCVVHNPWGSGAV